MKSHQKDNAHCYLLRGVLQAKRCAETVRFGGLQRKGNELRHGLQPNIQTIPIVGKIHGHLLKVFPPFFGNMSYSRRHSSDGEIATTNSQVINSHFSCLILSKMGAKGWTICRSNPKVCNSIRSAIKIWFSSSFTSFMKEKIKNYSILITMKTRSKNYRFVRYSNTPKDFLHFDISSAHSLQWFSWKLVYHFFCLRSEKNRRCRHDKSVMSLEALKSIKPMEENLGGADNQSMPVDWGYVLILSTKINWTISKRNAQIKFFA